MAHQTGKPIGHWALSPSSALCSFFPIYCMVLAVRPSVLRRKCGHYCALYAWVQQVRWPGWRAPPLVAPLSPSRRTPLARSLLRHGRVLASVVVRLHTHRPTAVAAAVAAPTAAAAVVGVVAAVGSGGGAHLALEAHAEEGRLERRGLGRGVADGRQQRGNIFNHLRTRRANERSIRRTLSRSLTHTPQQFLN
jgi:hypothetical protein